MAEEKRNKRKILVNINGKDYSILTTEEDRDKVEEIAQYVNSKIRDAYKGPNLTTPLEATVLAAMNIASEFFVERQQKENLSSELNKRSRVLVERISSLLESE